MKNLLNNRWFQLTFVAVPLIISILYYFTDKGFVLPAVVISLFLLVSLLPLCKKRENLWMFVFSTVSLLPVNIRVSISVSQWMEDELYMDSPFLKVIIILIAFHVLFCLEQIILGVITRFIWKRQYKVEVE